MKRIRAFLDADIGAVVELFCKVFGRTHPFPPSVLHAYFQKLFFQNPWQDQELPSLVYEVDGRVAGFLGAIVRPMMFGARSVRLVVSNHFMVAPDDRSSLAAVELMKTLFSGRQDLTIAETRGLPRKIWEGLGGQTSLLYSLYWTRVLRPARYFLERLQDRIPASLIWPLRPACFAFDTLATRIPGSPFRVEEQRPQEEPSTALLTKCISEKIDRRFLRPVYTEDSLTWLLSVVEEKRSHGTLRRGIVRNGSKEIIGWYLYLLQPSAYALVLQFWSAPEAVHEVLSHLFYHAAKQGAAAVTGRLEPNLMQEFSDVGCFFHRGGRTWMLVQSPDSSILQAFGRGRAFISYLEGEWWVSYRGG